MEPLVRILIVDDESHARDRLRRLVSELDGDYQVVAMAAHGEDALELCDSLAADLVLLDIEMPGMDGLATARRLSDLEPPPAVIMVTAYPQYALEAFEGRAADYLLKPVRRERLLSALERACTATRPQRESPPGATTVAPVRRRRRLSARYRGSLQVVPLEEIIYLQAEQKYVTARHRNGRMLLDESLRSLADEFPDIFIRIHRNALVARQRLTGLERGRKGTNLVRMNGCEERLPVSRRHLPEIRRWLLQRGAPE